jgi:hypothetical protein
MSQAKSKHLVETIADATLWEAIVDGVNTIGTNDEAAFEFDEDGLRVRVKDAANVAMIAQTIDADGFDHYDVDGEVTTGVDTDRFADLLDVASGDDPVRLNLNAETRKFEFEANGVEYDLTGIAPENMTGTPTDVPIIKDDHDMIVRCDLPVAKWSTGCDVVDLAGPDQGTFDFDPDTGDFVMIGKGDSDRSRVDLTDHDDFAWRDGEPDAPAVVTMSNKYMKQLVDVLADGDDEAVRFVMGTDLPIHVWQTHADGRIETKVLQAPRLSKQ